jgi:hypothetical protein
MMPYITPDYFRREMLIDLFSFHDTSRRNVFWAVLYTPEGKRLKESSATFLRQFDRDYYNGYQK